MFERKGSMVGGDIVARFQRDFYRHFIGDRVVYGERLDVRPTHHLDAFRFRLACGRNDRAVVNLKRFGHRHRYFPAERPRIGDRAAKSGYRGRFGRT